MVGMGGELVWRGGSARWRGSDGRRLGVEVWARAQSARRGWWRAGAEQRWAASWCGGVGAFTGGAAMGGALVSRGGGVYWRGSHRRRLGVEGWRRALARQRWAASWCGGVRVFTGWAAMGGALVSSGGGVSWRGSHRRRLGVEGWWRALAGQRWAASWCGGVGACTGGAAMGGAVVSRGGRERSRDRDEQRVGVEGWGRAQSGQRWAARWCGGVGASVVGAQGLVACRGGQQLASSDGRRPRGRVGAGSAGWRYVTGHRVETG